MQQQKNFVTILLMTSTLVLLISVQILWMRSTYNEVEENLRKETGSLFRSTIFAMHDSLIQKNIVPVERDSATIIVRRAEKRFGGPEILDPIRVRDSIMKTLRRPDDAAKIEVLITTGATEKTDSIARIIRPLMSRIDDVNEGPHKFMIRLGPDSLSVDSINSKYSTALKEAGIETAFIVESIKPERLRDEFRSQDRLRADVVRINPFHQYSVSFPEIDRLILFKITPQILFCVFLTLLTILSYTVLYRSLRSQQRLMQIKNDFISNVTHELKTPVATVSVALEALKNFHALDNPERTREYLQIAQQELNRLSLMTDNILRTAVFEEQGVEIRSGRVDLDKVVNEVVTSMRVVFEKKEVTFNYEKEGGNFFLDGGYEHITNVFYNLIDNALKYGGIPPKIEVKLKDLVDKLVVEVYDNGAGIAPEYINKIFDKFFRISSGDVHDVKGYGLGLSYVKSVAENHGGEILVESTPGKGSCFRIIFPRKK